MREAEVKAGLEEAVEWEEWRRGGLHLQETSAAPSMFRSWVERLKGELGEAAPNMKMWATTPAEKSLASNVEKLLREMGRFK